MSTEPSGWQSPKTNWTPDDNIGASDLNRWEGNSGAIETGERTLDPAQAPSSNKGSLRQILDWLANRIKAITGATNWYDAPATTLAAAKSHMDAASPHSGHATTTALNNHAGANITSSNTVHGIKQGSGNGFDADTLDGKHWVSIASGSTTVASKSTGSVKLEGAKSAKLLASVYTNDCVIDNSLLDATSGLSGWTIRRIGADASLTIQNTSDASRTYTYEVIAWQ